MKKVLLIIVVIVIILIGGFFVYKSLIKKEGEIPSSGKISMPEFIKGKKIAVVIAFREFRDEEYFIPKQILESAGAEVKTVSTSMGEAIGKLGGEAGVDLLIGDLKPVDYDAVLFIGGPGAANFIDNETCHRISRETVENNKVLGAICIAPAILAKAGVLNNKKATVWSSVLDKSAVKILKNSGAVYQSDSVVVDGKLVTADGPSAVKEFAEAIINLLK